MGTTARTRLLVPGNDGAQDGIAKQSQLAIDLLGLAAQGKPEGGGLGIRAVVDQVVVALGGFLGGSAQKGLHRQRSGLRLRRFEDGQSGHNETPKSGMMPRLWREGFSV
jgi:hypothetical protein